MNIRDIKNINPQHILEKLNKFFEDGGDVPEDIVREQVMPDIETIKEQVLGELGRFALQMDLKTLDDAYAFIKDIPEVSEDTGAWFIRYDDKEVLLRLLEEPEFHSHPFTKWIIHNTKSFGERKQSLRGDYFLDFAIFSGLDEETLNEITARTLKDINARIGEPYYYDPRGNTTEYYLEHFNDARIVAENYAVHHNRFRHHLLENINTLAKEMVGQGVDLSFWNQPMNFGELLEAIIGRPADNMAALEAGSSTTEWENPEKTPEKEPEKEPEKTKKEDKKKDLSSGRFKVHLPEKAPTLDEYKTHNILQEGLAEEIETFFDNQLYDKAASSWGAHTSSDRHHLMFSGPPGTGKTTLARVLGRYLNDLEFLSKGHVVETTATALVGNYVGQTGQHVRDAFEQARGGVLFIDEIYHLVNDKNFGPDATNQLLALMENEKDDLVVIVAGYEDMNHKFLETNPGLRDRFSDEFIFEHFSGDDLRKILYINLEKRGLTMDDDAAELFLKYLQKDKEGNPKEYANARTLEKVLLQVKSQNARLKRASLAVSDFNEVAQADRDNILNITAEAVQAAITKLEKGKKPSGFGFVSAANSSNDNSAPIQVPAAAM